jgi:hypothetical protein
MQSRHSHVGLHAGTPRQRNAVFAEKFPQYLVLMREVGQVSPTCEGYFYTIWDAAFDYRLVLNVYSMYVLKLHLTVSKASALLLLPFGNLMKNVQEN